MLRGLKAEGPRRSPKVPEGPRRSPAVPEEDQRGKQCPHHESEDVPDTIVIVSNDTTDCSYID